MKNRTRRSKDGELGSVRHVTPAHAGIRTLAREFVARHVSHYTTETQRLKDYIKSEVTM